MTEKKYFIEDIKGCTAYCRQGNTYELKCMVHRQALWPYVYTEGDSFITRYNKKNYLGGKALNVINKAIRELDKVLASITIQKQYDMTVVFEQLGLKLYLRHEPVEDIYDVLFETDCGNDAYRLSRAANLRPNELLHEMRFYTEKTEPEDLFQPVPENLNEHPLYLAADSNNNTLLKAELELYYGYPEPDVLDYLQKEKRIRLLPKLGKALNREYVINWLDFSVIKPVLDLSGYRMLHTPYFSMQGNTHTKKQINPHCKYIIDSAPANEEPISLSEFFNLFGPDNSNT